MDKIKTTMQRDRVILVDEHDMAQGEMEKIAAHRQGLLHRAFSVFIFNTNGQMLIHQRAVNKYHGAGLWTNACCSHPQHGEALLDSAAERLYFEMGIHCELQHVFSFLYRGEVENGLIEHELDHVFIGYYDGMPRPNEDEVADYRWIDVQELHQWMSRSPDAFTIWFRQALPMLLQQLPLSADDD